MVSYIYNVMYVGIIGGLKCHYIWIILIISSIKGLVYVDVMEGEETRNSCLTGKCNSIQVTRQNHH